MAPLGGHEGGTAALAARLDADGTVQLACGGFARGEVRVRAMRPASRAERGSPEPRRPSR